MRTLLAAALLLAAPALTAAEHTIAVVGLVHSHVWGHLEKMAKGESGARLVGVAETNPALVAEARKAGVADNLIQADWKKMVDTVKPEMVWAFVENNRHREIVEYLAPRKIHILFEKPLAATHRDAVAIRELARKNNVQVLSNYQMAWWPSNTRAHELVKSGVIGDVWRIRGIVGHGGPGSEGARSQYFFNWLTDPVQNGGGALVDFGCYNALWSLWYLGRPETVSATVLHLRPERFPKVEDHASIVLTYPKAVAQLEASWDLPKSYQDLEVFGRKGETIGSVYMTRNGVELRKGYQAQQGEKLALEPLPANVAEPVRTMITAIETGKPIEGITAMDINVDVMEIIDAAKESVRTGKPVRLKPRS